MLCETACSLHLKGAVGNQAMGEIADKAELGEFGACYQMVLF